MDPTNPVVKLCAEGMAAEMAGKLEEAQALFALAWAGARDDYEACVAAHFVARHQADPRECLRWNEVALARAEAARGERVRGFYPSLYLNLGFAHENLDDLAAARRFYDLAAARLADLEAGAYGETVRGGIAAGLARLEARRTMAP